MTFKSLRYFATLRKAMDSALKTPPPKRRRRKDARPAEIIEAGLQEFAENGFAGTKLEEVARRAGIVKGTIYRYFDSKDALFEAALKARLTPFIDEVEQLAAAFPGSSTELLQLTMRLVYGRMFQPDAQALMRIIMSEGRRFPAITELYHRETVSKGRRMIAAIVARGVARGEFRAGAAADLPMVVMAPAIMAAVWKMTFEPFDPLDIEKFAAAHADLAFNGILARGATAP